jgi:hypothetical protein
MSANQFNKFFCAICGELTKLVKINDEVYPGQFSTSYISDCCQAGIVNQYDKPYLYGELQNAYEDQLSNEVED